MDFISKIKERRKLIITIFCLSILSFLGLCILCYHLYIKLDRLTNPDYFPPEVETKLLAAINVSEFEILPVEHIKNAMEVTAEQNIEFMYNKGRPFTDYETMPDSLQLLIDEFISGFLARKNKEAKYETIPEVIKEDLIKYLTFNVTEYGVLFSLRYAYLDYSYTYYPDGVIHKELVFKLTRGLNTIYHYIDNDQIGVEKSYDVLSYHMINTGEIIRKNLSYVPDKKLYGDQIRIEDYNLFRSAYLEGKVPWNFILTIKNIQKYVDKIIID